MIEIQPIPPTRRQLTRAVKWAIDLYKNNPCYVPPLIFDEVETLMPDKNPAFDFCRAQTFIALDNGKTCGRITAIINDIANARTNRREARFGFIDFIDNPQVSQALLNAAEQWARSQGMTTIIGPMGFTDMDHEGMLIDGFDQPGTMATIYNHPYYPRHLEQLGYQKEIDWVEYRMEIPPKVPEKMARIAHIVAGKHHLRTLRYTSRSRLKADYGQALFNLINTAYDKLYGYSPLTPRQIQYYISMYLGMINLDYISIIVDPTDRLIGIGITMPSLTKALQKSRGRLFPTGWYHLLRALKSHNDTVDLMLVAIHPEYQNKGVNALLFNDLIPQYNRHGVRWAESNLELEDNLQVQAQWQYFNRHQHRRRRAYRKNL